MCVLANGPYICCKQWQWRGGVLLFLAILLAAWLTILMALMCCVAIVCNVAAYGVWRGVLFLFFVQCVMA